MVLPFKSATQDRDRAAPSDDREWLKLPRGIAFAVLLAVPLWILLAALAFWLLG